MINIALPLFVLTLYHTILTNEASKKAILLGPKGPSFLAVFTKKVNGVLLPNTSLLTSSSTLVEF